MTIFAKIPIEKKNDNLLSFYVIIQKQKNLLSQQTCYSYQAGSNNAYAFISPIFKCEHNRHL